MYEPSVRGCGLGRGTTSQGEQGGEPCPVGKSSSYVFTLKGKQEIDKVSEARLAAGPGLAKTVKQVKMVPCFSIFFPQSHIDYPLGSPAVPHLTCPSQRAPCVPEAAPGIRKTLGSNPSITTYWEASAQLPKPSSLLYPSVKWGYENISKSCCDA